jgi:putative flavoprotein involved in K+ transport
VRTSPNIFRRDTKGFPTQLVGIVPQRLPPQLLEPHILALRRATIRDLTAYGLPPPSAPFSQFSRTATVPIIDVGFIDAIPRPPAWRRNLGALLDLECAPGCRLVM